MLGGTRHTLPDKAQTATEASKPGFMPALTARMRARLQDFPDHWQFAGGKPATADQIGNAVSARLAQALGRGMCAAIKVVTWNMKAMLWPDQAVRTRVEAPPLQAEFGAAVRPPNEVAIRVERPLVDSCATVDNGQEIAS
ncbi:hypothetical protein GOD83_24665 [Sinorhizobium medicae]|nr:hypothetical protein [Sinorhizobium medicae]MDX0579838.1 hypothetical protein [Sinorhizobium medicae]MDX0783472.1 hypothetical protein [Sinorhizobium medicae]